MRNFLKIVDGVDVLPLVHSLQRHPDLWNEDRCRTTFENSPHAQVDDILLRFEAFDPAAPDLEAELERAPRTFRHAWDVLPEARPIIAGLMVRVGAYELARVVITRLAPGGQILPHADTRGSYANLPDIARYHVVLQGLPGSLFHCGGEDVCMETGQVYWFNAHEIHACINNSIDDRIHMLVDVRLFS